MPTQNASATTNVPVVVVPKHSATNANKAADSATDFFPIRVATNQWTKKENAEIHEDNAQAFSSFNKALSIAVFVLSLGLVWVAYAGRSREAFLTSIMVAVAANTVIWLIGKWAAKYEHRKARERDESFKPTPKADLQYTVLDPHHIFNDAFDDESGFRCKLAYSKSGSSIRPNYLELNASSATVRLTKSGFADPEQWQKFCQWLAFPENEQTTPTVFLDDSSQSVVTVLGSPKPIEIKALVATGKLQRPEDQSVSAIRFMIGGKLDWYTAGLLYLGLSTAILMFCSPAGQMLYLRALILLVLGILGYPLREKIRRRNELAQLLADVKGWSCCSESVSIQFKDNVFSWQWTQFKQVMDVESGLLFSASNGGVNILLPKLTASEDEVKKIFDWASKHGVQINRVPGH